MATQGDGTYRFTLSPGTYRLRAELTGFDRLEREHDNLRAALDWAIVVGYIVWVVYNGLRRSKGTDKVEGYFLGNRTLPWWAIGLSVMAVIGRERFGEFLSGFHIVDEHFKTEKNDLRGPLELPRNALGKVVRAQL